MKGLICLLSIFVVVVQSKVYLKPISTVDRQLIDFAHSALKSSFRDDQGLQSPSIRRLRSAVRLSSQWNRKDSRFRLGRSARNSSNLHRRIPSEGLRSGR